MTLKNLEISQLYRMCKKPPLVYTSPDAPIGEAMRLMANHHILSLPVHSHSNNNNIVNIINIFDLLDYLVFHSHAPANQADRGVQLTPEDFEKPVESVMTLDYDKESYRVWDFDVRDTMKGVSCVYYTVMCWAECL
jgi:CBS-domain-containing membrane protein